MPNKPAKQAEKPLTTTIYVQRIGQFICPLCCKRIRVDYIDLQMLEVGDPMPTCPWCGAKTVVGEVKEC